MSSYNGEDAWILYARSVFPIKDSNKYIPPLQRLRYPVDQSRLSFIRQQRNLINSQQTEGHSPMLFNRKQRKSFRSEAYIDLHDNIKNIDEVLSDFCTRCIIKNIRYISIITGKRHGIVRGNVVSWLRTHNEFVNKYFEITDSFNTCGSIGVHLRGLK